MNERTYSTAEPTSLNGATNNTELAVDFKEVVAFFKNYAAT